MDGLVKEKGGQEGKEKGKRPLPLPIHRSVWNFCPFPTRRLVLSPGRKHGDFVD